MHSNDTTGHISVFVNLLYLKKEIWFRLLN